MKHAATSAAPGRALVTACLRLPHGAPRTPSFGLMSNLAARPSSHAETVRNRARAQHPSQSARACLPCPGRAAAPSYSAPPWLASRLTSTAQKRCLSPTSATDVRYEHPTIRSTPKLAACAAKTTSAMCPELLTPCHPERGVGPPCGNLTPGGAAFDDASPASDVPPTFLFVIEEDTGSARRQSHPARGFLGRGRAGDPASDAPCRAPLRPVARRVRSARTASTALASTRAASPIRSAFRRQVALRRFRGESPPPFPQLRRRGPASDALSLLALLSHGGARPSPVVTGYSPVVVRTARRLPTSAIDTNCEHNRLIDRAPHTTPESPPAQLL